MCVCMYESVHTDTHSQGSNSSSEFHFFPVEDVEAESGNILFFSYFH